MKRKPYFDEICEHACTELDYRTMICVTTKKRELAGAEYELFVDVTTFDNYDEMVEFCQRYFQDEEVLFPYGHNFPDEYIEDGLRFQDIKQFGCLNKEQQNAIELYIYGYLACEAYKRYWTFILALLRQKKRLQSIS